MSDRVLARERSPHDEPGASIVRYAASRGITDPAAALSEYQAAIARGDRPRDLALESDAAGRRGWRKTRRERGAFVRLTRDLARLASEAGGVSQDDFVADIRQFLGDLDPDPTPRRPAGLAGGAAKQLMGIIAEAKRNGLSADETAEALREFDQDRGDDARPRRRS